MSEDEQRLPQKISQQNDTKPGVYRPRFGALRGSNQDPLESATSGRALHAIERRVQMAIRSEVSNGPYPPPSFLEGYDQIDPGSAGKILDVASRRVDATTQILLNESKSRIDIDRRGQLMAFVVVVIVLAVATIWVWLGHSTAGATLAVGLIIALVIAFIGSSRIEAVAPFITGRKNQSGSETTDDADEEVDRE